MSRRKARQVKARKATPANGQATRSARGGRSTTSGLVDVETPGLQMALGVWQLGQHDQAIDLYRKEIGNKPNNVRAYIMLARAMADAYRLDDLERVLNQLLSLNPSHPGVHHFIGETYALMNLVGPAVKAYERASRLPNVLPGTWMDLAILYERSHRLDEARELIERAERAGLDLPARFLVQARLERREKHPDRAESLLRDLIDRLPADSDWAAQAWSELAALYDQSGAYDQALQSIGRCKQIQLLQHPEKWLASQRVVERFARLSETLTRGDLERWRAQTSGLAERRTAILAGFPRSGTTLLEQVLDAHPELISSEERDLMGKVQFTQWQSMQQRNGPVMAVLDAIPVSRIRAEQERYFRVMERLLGEPIGHRVHLDKNPAYNLFLPVVLRLLPATRVIIALRDPRDVLISCYLRYLPVNPVSQWFLTPLRTAERYAVDMNAWLKLRGILPEPWCQVRYEDSVADLESQARRTLQTLGLPWDPAVMNYRDRLGKQRQVSSPTYEAVKQPIYTRSIGRWKHYQALLEPVLSTLEPFIEAFGYER